MAETATSETATATTEAVAKGATGTPGRDEIRRASVFVGAEALRENTALVSGAFVDAGGERYYRIENVDRMAPFFVTVVSASDHWLFASSTGALTAGRGTPERALFPYETVDRIYDAQDRTGGKTLVLAARGDAARQELWEPFSDRYAGLQPVRRSLAKSPLGDRLRYEETHEGLGLTFAATWATSERYGFARSAEIVNAGAEPVRLRILDGLQHLMPYGVTRAMQETRSVLAEAYMQHERREGSALGVFALSAQPVDRAEPSEALRATTVWQAGLPADAVLLSAAQLARFRRGDALVPETLVRARRGAYFAHAAVTLAPGERLAWDVVAEIEQDAAAVVALEEALADPDALRAALHDDIAAGRRRLRALVAAADGEQATADAMTVARHRTNVLYNVMRGGVFDEGYTVRREAVRAFVAHHNAPLAKAQNAFFDRLPEALSARALREAAEAGPPQLRRLCAQFLPLHFSRRHGDPSRPWNHFSIAVRTPDGSVRRGYEGNWRDIFQNWETLGHAFPDYLEGMVSIFASASTADGYNPYRITDRGIDWETIEPDDPWSYIGYWGDHQIIYLLRLLGALHAHAPARLVALLGERRFSYANVPYRIKPYPELLRDPHVTIAFDEAEAARIDARVAAAGADGKLLWQAEGEPLLVTLAEKLLVPLLAKLTNFVPGGGIWMNTQRPEWNDANNALVGYGVSVVTLFAVRRYLAFLDALLAEAAGSGRASFPVSAEIAGFLGDVREALDAVPDGPLDDRARRRAVDALGEAGSRYRAALYTHGLSGETRDVEAATLRGFAARALALVDATLAESRRPDGLVDSYNVLRIGEDTLAVEPLYPMLEGQVAALDAAVLAPEDALALLETLRASAMYRPDQHSYTLYPDRALPGFVEKNTLPPDVLRNAPVLEALIAEGDTSVVVRDVRGGVHFSGALTNRRDLEAALDRLAAAGRPLSAADRQAALDAFETVFNHRAYTGRSGTFFAYEGLGSIYWHMVSKLALAVQETFFRAYEEDASKPVLRRLADAYYDVCAGLGGGKSPEEYGAFPTDAYSHTPAHAGAQQPGMTGQVKEDVLCRWGELGVRVKAGRIAFRPLLLREAEFLRAPATFRFADVQGREQALSLKAGTLGFTYCGTPVVYRRARALGVRVVLDSGETVAAPDGALPPALSADVFGRTGRVARIEVDAPALR